MNPVGVGGSLDGRPGEGGDVAGEKAGKGVPARAFPSPQTPLDGATPPSPFRLSVAPAGAFRALRVKRSAPVSPPPA